MKRAVLWAVTVGLVLVAILGFAKFWEERRVPSEAVVVPSTAIASPGRATESVAPSASPTTVVPVEPTETEVTLTPVPVPVAPARAIALPAIGYAAEVHYLATNGYDVDPPDYISSWGATDYGSFPGTDADNVVYMYCHTARAVDFGVSVGEVDQLAPCRLFQRAYESNSLLGELVTIRTDAGELTYRVDQVLYNLTPDEYKYNQVVRAIVPGRLIITTCMYDDNGGYSDHKFVVIASLGE